MKNGEERAFKELYGRYSKKMLFFFYQRLNNDNERAQDLLQDLFLKIIEKPESFDKSRKFSVWIYVVASNMCKNEYRRKRNRCNSIVSNNMFDESKIDRIQPSGFLEEIDLKNFADRLASELNLMGDKHSLTFVLKHQQGLTIKEISDIMDCSEGTVKSRLFYSIKKLSNKLQMYNFQNEKLL
jgi:RNA polymerase sigma-70 factor (ECF subfamily)|tara:strand:+ start:836 stop:1384 length:549 start_codon:yes stop_codon:yes gene_type:complete